MNIGNQIKALRLRRGVTQETLAQHLGLTPQAISKWECGLSTPDITMLPDLSSYFGVSIDELFALTDDVRMERIQNMLWDIRFLNHADVENEKSFLLDKGHREPNNNVPYELLANLELHLANEHNARAQEYALEAIKRNPYSCRGYTALAHAMGGKHVDPRNNTHNALISFYKTCIQMYPDATDAYVWLISQLIDDRRLEEATKYCELMSKYDNSYRLTVHLIKIALAKNDINSAKAMWEKMGTDYPNNWSVFHWIGDFQSQIGEYEEAKASYSKAINMMSTPRYTDPIDSLAKACEASGDIKGAIAARKTELEIGEKEWGDTAGETVDYINREITRLEKLLN